MEFTVRSITDLKQCLINVIIGRKMHVIETKIFVLTSILLPREMLFYEPEVSLNGWKFEDFSADKHLEVGCDIDLH